MTRPIIYSQECIEYEAPGHPESPERIISAHKYLSDKYEFISARPATEAEILGVHTAEHLESVKNRSFSNPDCPRYENIYHYATLAAGAAIQASEQNGFSLMRPPGHHATSNHVAGFCYFNNIAIAVKNLGAHTLIIDIDGHHGDGTEAIFLGDPDVTFLSLHSSPNYPGTGLQSQGNCINAPLPFRCGNEAFLRALGENLDGLDLTKVKHVAVSAGFDTFELDPLASLGITRECYEAIGEVIASIKLPTFAVLEGGYDAANLGPNIDAFLTGLF